MINFRFHVVSVIAIFLALALGVVIGAGVIDRGIVDALDTQLNRVEAKSERINDDNDRLTGENEDPRPDDRADPQHDELAGTEDAPEATGAFLAQLLAGDLLDRFGLEDGHARSL